MNLNITNFHHEAAQVIHSYQTFIFTSLPFKLYTWKSTSIYLNTLINTPNHQIQEKTKLKYWTSMAAEMELNLTHQNFNFSSINQFPTILVIILMKQEMKTTTYLF